MKNMERTEKTLRRFKWKHPDIDRLPLQFSIADSVLKEFVQSHGPSAVLTELVQNEYDAQGTKLEMLFGDHSVIVTGNGKPVNNAGWGRLSVMLGTGTVAGSDRTIEAKVNSIGSKNFGLRSLFIYGDQIYIRSGGRQTVLDRLRGALPKPLPERSSRRRSGIHIEVPYRTATKGDMEAFDVEKEAQAFNRFSKDVTPMLIKLANPGYSKSLQELVVSSRRCHRRIIWQQSVVTIPSFNRRVKALHRTITMKDTQRTEQSSKHVQKLEEVEFEMSLRIPERFQQQNIPEYFRVSGGRIRLALSIRIKQGKIDLSEPGFFYYPLGLIHAYTGKGISVNTPFQLDNDRTRIIDPENSPWNEWLLEKAADLTIELLLSDWFDRFGSQIYLALDETSRPAITYYLDLLNSKLETESCWPTRARKRERIQFACAKNIVIPIDEKLGGFLSANRYLDERLDDTAEIISMIRRYGAKQFTVNSLVRLRCFGQDYGSMITELNSEEADYYYTDFPDAVRDEGLQTRFAVALDSQARRLSQENRGDLRNSASTLAADGSLKAPSSPLWVVEPSLAQVCPVPKAQRLHPSLVTSKAITGLCRRFDSSDWVRRTAERIQANQATEEEQEALYRYILSVHGHLGRKTQALLRRLPVLRDHRGERVAPCQITARKFAVAKRLEAALHFPNRDYVGDIELARAFRFKHQIERKDIVEYAWLVKNRPELAEDFEETLQRLSALLTRPLARQLSQVPFLRDSMGGVSAPIELYIRNRLNHICLGDEAPFVQGKRVGLYKQLECKEKPKADDIVRYLRELTDKPEQPEVMYATLASALRIEGLPPDYYSKELIIWNGSSYSSPENTLLGSRYRRIFLDAVPCISVTSKQLREIFYSLGVCSQPQEGHWKQLLVWFGQRYQDSDSPVPENERRILRKTYRELGGIPEGLPTDSKYLLDRQGKLHDMSDVYDGRFLIDDNPQMAQAVVGQGIPLSFADTSEQGTLGFFRAAGVKSLTGVQQRQRINIGELTDPPVWCNPSLILKHIHSSEFASALTALKEYELKGSIGSTPIGTSGLYTRLNKIQQISFAREIKGVYKIDNYSIYTSENFAVGEDSIIMLRVRSNSELFGLLSQIIATMLIDSVTFQRIFSDAIYRLLTCRSIREMKNYLNNRGIPWQPSSRALEDWEEGQEGESEYDLGEDEIGNVLADLLKQSVAKGKGAGTPKYSPKEPEGEKPTTSAPKPVSLPPLESIEVNMLEPSDTWTPSVPKGGGGGGPSSWTPPGPSDEEWQRAVGRRGEEIVYQQELNRVRKMEYPESRVIWVADQDPDADFDIQSVDDDGEDIWIEVKSTTGREGRFRWPKAEFEKAIAKRNRYILWRVYEADTLKPCVKPFRDPVGILLRKGMRLDIDTFNAMVEPMQA